jgi:hypothetical protein
MVGDSHGASGRAMRKENEQPDWWLDEMAFAEVGVEKTPPSLALGGQPCRASATSLCLFSTTLCSLAQTTR